MNNEEKEKLKECLQELNDFNMLLISNILSKNNLGNTDIIIDHVDDRYDTTFNNVIVYPTNEGIYTVHDKAKRPVAHFEKDEGLTVENVLSLKNAMINFTSYIEYLIEVNDTKKSPAYCALIASPDIFNNYLISKELTFEDLEKEEKIKRVEKIENKIKHKGRKLR